jgi:Heterogeneous nuclear ribonucleoprotein Q acidic domain
MRRDARHLQFSMDLLDDKVLGSLKELSASDQASVMRQFFRTEIASMKNPSAYLSGIIRSSRTPSSGAGNAPSRMKRSSVGKQLELMYRQYDFARRRIIRLW